MNCRDCAVPPGEPHHNGCSVARCPEHGWQRLTCGCGGDPPSVWTGRFPGLDEIEQWQILDLNTLGVLAGKGVFGWDRERQRWEPIPGYGCPSCKRGLLVTSVRSIEGTNDYSRYRCGHQTPAPAGRKTPMTFLKTVAVDFDKVCHSYDHGWGDGSIYGRLVPGTTACLRVLLERYAVYILTSRKPLDDVARWLERQTGIPAIAERLPERTFWDVPDVLLVTDQKLPAEVYLDDRAVRFETWEQAIADIYSVTARPRRQPQGSEPMYDDRDHHMAHALLERQRLIDDVSSLAKDDEDDPAVVLDSIRERLAEGVKEPLADSGVEGRAPKSAADLETK